MKNTKPGKRPSRDNGSVLRQIVEHIPTFLVSRLAREHGIDKQARSFTPWSHVVALLYAQLSHALSLNDVCDSLRQYVGRLWAIRGAKAPSRNALSHANRQRPSGMAQALFWGTLRHLQTQHPGFARCGDHSLAWRFRRNIHIVDATVIQLVASCIDWAKHRRRKAAAKCHLRISLRSLLPNFAVIDTAKENECRRVRELCAALEAGEVVLFDRGYCALSFFHDLTMRGVFFVTRAKENFTCRVLKRRSCRTDPRIISDEEVEMVGELSRGRYPGRLRKVTAVVEVDGRDCKLVFLTNNFEWSASSVAELYRCRWQIEVLFRQLKQNLQLADFLGHNANAVQWQIWMALLAYVLLRFIAWMGRWSHGFSRLYTLMRATLWLTRSVWDALRRCGTADGDYLLFEHPAQSSLPGFA